MFYKSNYDVGTQKLIDENPLEFTLVLKEKLSGFSQYTTGYIVHGDARLKPVMVEESHNTSRNCNSEPLLEAYFDSRGLRNTKFFRAPHLQVIASDVSERYEVSSTSRHAGKVYDKAVYDKLKDKLSDFFIVREDKMVCGKNKDYRIKIVHNADASIGADVIVDELSLYEGDKKVGYLKVKYTTPDVIKKLGGDPKAKNIFKNMASIDYSHLNEDKRGQGLGYLMYFHMAQYLHKNKLQFRASTMQSDSAQRLWAGIAKNWSAHLKMKNFNGEKKIFLTMTENLRLSFLDGTPRIEEDDINNIKKVNHITYPKLS